MPADIQLGHEGEITLKESIDSPLTRTISPHIDSLHTPHTLNSDGTIQETTIKSSSQQPSLFGEFSDPDQLTRAGRDVQLLVQCESTQETTVDIQLIQLLDGQENPGGCLP